MVCQSKYALPDGLTPMLECADSHHVMFDIDGTLVESFKFDEECYLDAVFEVLGQKIDSDWSKYDHVTDSGILHRHLALNGLLDRKEEIHEQVKSVFVEKVEEHILKSPVQAIPGAVAFFNSFKKIPNISLSLATGGWRETAVMKLNSAGFDISDVALSSSNDHYSRIEIMKNALAKSSVKPGVKITYFGDGEWDKKACEQLGINFVLIGNRTDHKQRIDDFSLADVAYNYIGLRGSRST